MGIRDVQTRYTWEQAIETLRSDPKHRNLIFDAYLTADLRDNCRRFSSSVEFNESLNLLRVHAAGFRTILDMPAGNGIATVAFANSGYEVTAVEPDQSLTVGRGAIAFNLQQDGLSAKVVDAFAENLPFADATFDVVYVRQGLHHAKDLIRMAAEIFRVLRPGGVLLAVREHVVDDYTGSLRRFLNSQVDHQLYGGENAFTLTDYRSALAGAGLKTIVELGPYDSPINIYPNDASTLRHKILDSTQGRLLGVFMPAKFVVRVGWWRLKTRKAPGRLYSFLCRKPS
jgi:SAM-dependent methyltransferase